MYALFIQVSFYMTPYFLDYGNIMTTYISLQLRSGVVCN